MASKDREMRCALAFALVVAMSAVLPGAAGPVAGSCFILHEVGVGQIRRAPSSTCAVRVSPQSTFKIPHALAALDAGVISGVDEKMTYDGRPADFPLWRQDHTLATAMRDSVVWYFQETAKRLGPGRERGYLARFNYGNQDSSSGLTGFWLGGSLAISPDEQLRFLERLYDGSLPVSRKAVESVSEILRQPAGSVVNAAGAHPFAGRWPEGTVLSAKTGAGPTSDGAAVRWLVGHVRRESRSWIFVSNVVGTSDTPALAAIEQAERALQEARVLR
jgi:beta-lactamase class D